MKYVPFILKHLRRNWVRTTSTVIAMAVCIFLLYTLQTFLKAVTWNLQSAKNGRLVVQDHISLIYNVPLSYEARIAAVPGVKRISVLTWFGGSRDINKPSDFFPNMGVEPETYLAMYPEYILPEDQKRAFINDMRGCIVGRDTAERFHWKIGDRFQLESFIPPYRVGKPFEFVVDGIFDADPVQHPGVDLTQMFFNYKYLYEASGRRVGAGTYVVEINDPQQSGAISKTIDDMFENSDNQTRTQTESAFLAGFVSMAGNLALLLNGIALAVMFTILLVTANTMSMAVRERRTEIAVLKTLGFSSAQVMGLIVAEALALGLLGGALGIGGSKMVMWTLTTVPGIRDMLLGLGLTSLGLKPVVALLGLGVSLLLGFAAGFTPAWGAYRARITDMLRTV